MIKTDYGYRFIVPQQFMNESLYEYLKGVSERRAGFEILEDPPEPLETFLETLITPWSPAGGISLEEREFVEFAPSPDLTESFRRDYNSFAAIGVRGWLMGLRISFQESSELLTASAIGALSGLAEIVRQRSLGNGPTEVVGALRDLLVGAVATRLGRPSLDERLKIADSLVSELKQRLRQARLEVDGATLYADAEGHRLFLRLLPSLTFEEILESPNDWEIETVSL